MSTFESTTYRMRNLQSENGPVRRRQNNVSTLNRFRRPYEGLGVVALEIAHGARPGGSVANPRLGESATRDDIFDV